MLPIRSIASVLTAILVVAACGGASGPGAPAAPAATTGAPAAAAKPKFEVSSYAYAIQAKGKLRVGTQEDNPPFSVKNPVNNKWEGFDTEIARDLARAIFGNVADIDANIEWVPVTSATRIGFLTDNKADVIVKTFTINEDRKKQIDFSDVYFKTGQKILVKKDNTTITNAASLSGKTTCTQRGSTSEKNITTAAGTGARLLLLASYPECLLALQQGTADAVSTDETILFGLVARDSNTKIVGAYFSTEDYGIGLKKNVDGDRNGFNEMVNTAVKAMIADGRWAAHYKKFISPVAGDEKKAP